ncbi:putative pre-mRNA-splicing factor SYF1 [Gregarina niphandrodes]|uniref:Pre-mRNA-splicing factor SYF1 n=1 Tax=Gregarina niphandrodes TaxID=110365 RepID=A0A023B3C3_GRENI|nr:putative pre-mRNA-splicing factor SYF1 [Gregarina niphandrodes]EZG55410.1 putative pre-mRNA-splicing factor SYF1 [Gregarina niphandrodes]|eukprot:XP_011131584.1 putative pre-mRNA-splicing factor SYF1 [Gregarina niphandrodes]
MDEVSHFVTIADVEQATGGIYSKEFIGLFKDINDDPRTVGYEKSVEGNPLNIQSWLQYINFKRNASYGCRILLFLRALRYSPMSYKLWMRVLREVDRYIVEFYASREELASSENEDREAVLDFLEAIYRKGMSHMYKYPKARLMYTRMLWEVRGRITGTRREFDDVLRTLPITQHHLVWPAYIKFVKESRCPSTCLSVYRRCIQLMPEYREDFVRFLLELEMWTHGIKQLSQLCLSSNYTGTWSRRDMWKTLCQLLCEHPHAITTVESERLIRLGVSQFTSSVASLWCGLAGYYSALNEFDSCIAIYEEALGTVETVEDFTTIFKSITGYLKATAEKLMAQSNERGQEEELTIEYILEKLEYLLKHRGDLLSLMRIRKNPHDVYEWLNRAYYFMRDDDHQTDGDSGRKYDHTKIPDIQKVLEVFDEAIRTIDPIRATGPYSAIWIECSSLLEKLDRTDEARQLLERAAHHANKNVEGLVSIWCERIELEIRCLCYNQALHLARLAISRTYYKKKLKADDGKGTDMNDSHNQDNDDSDERTSILRSRLCKSVRLWAILFDLELCFGTDLTIKAAFDQMMAYKTATIPQILCFAVYAEKHHRFEEAFQIYEKAITLYHWPQVGELWLEYLSKFCSRYRKKKIERARELFDKVTSQAPATEAWRFYFMYARFEEQFGLIRNALSILHKAASHVQDQEKFDVYKILIAWSAKYFGITATRPIFQEALTVLPDSDLVSMGLRFAEMELTVLETDRARAIFEHVSQFTRSADDELWQRWSDLELRHGTDSTFADMLRKKKAATLFVHQAVET